MVAKKAAKKAAKKGTTKKSNATKGGSQKTKPVEITMTVQEDAYAFVEVPFDATKEDLEQIVEALAIRGPYELQDDPQVLDYTVKELDEKDRNAVSCSAVWKDDRYRFITKKQSRGRK